MNLQEILGKIATIAVGDVSAVQAEIASVKEELAANTASDADREIAIQALVDKLAVSTPAPVVDEPVNEDSFPAPIPSV